GHAARRLGDHGDDLRVARRGPVIGAGDQQSRLSRRTGGGVPPRLHVRARQSLRRRRVHVPRPAHPTVVSTRATALPMPEALAPARSEWWIFLPRLARGGASRFGAIVVVLVPGAALGAAWVTPFAPVEQHIGDRLKSPGSHDAAGAVHLLGTDHLGRDILARIVFGARPALLVGFAAVAISGVLGMMAGLAAGYFGGRIDDVLRRLAGLPPA